MRKIRISATLQNRQVMIEMFLTRKFKTRLIFTGKFPNLWYASVNDYQISSIVHNELQVLANTLIGGYSFHYEVH